MAKAKAKKPVQKKKPTKRGAGEPAPLDPIGEALRRRRAQLLAR